MKFYFILISLVLSFFFFSCYHESKEERMKFDQIRDGMTTRQVKSILGNPDDVIVSFDSTVYYYYYTKQKKPSRKTLPVVVFSKAGKVIFSTYGDGPKVRW